jgi:hypothetical protein
VQTRKVYLRPSARSLLENAPTRVAALLAQYLNLIEGYAQLKKVKSCRTEVSGFQDPEDGSRQLMITHMVGLSQDDLRTYRGNLGTVIEEWVRGLSPEELDLMQKWFILEVVPNREINRS